MAAIERQQLLRRLQEVLEALPHHQNPRFSPYAPPADFDDLVTALSGHADQGLDTLVQEIDRMSGSINGDAMRHAVAIVLEHHPKI